MRLPLSCLLVLFAALFLCVHAPAQSAVIGFSASQFNVTEDVSSAVIQVRRSGNLDTTCSVDYFTSDGSAVAFRDYWPQLGTLVFAPGQSELTLAVSIFNRAPIDGDRTVQLTLANVSSTAVLDEHLNQAILTIHDSRVPLMLDPLFKPGELDGPVRAVAWLPDGRVLIGGDFNHVGGTLRPGIAQLETNGSVDLSFISPLAEGALVRALTVLSNGQFYIGGRFAPAAEADVLAHTARLRPDGALDLTFALTSPDFENYYGRMVQSLAVDADGRVVIAGDFYFIDGELRRQVARLLSNGVLDPNFAPEACYLFQYKSILLQPDGGIIAAGGGLALEIGHVGNCERFLSDGTKDSSFTNRCTFREWKVGGEVIAMALQPDGKIIVGGELFELDGVNRGVVVRLNADGSFDPTFNCDVLAGYAFPISYSGPTIETLVLQPDGKVLVGLSPLASYKGRNGIVRLNADGSLDPTFNPANGVDGSVFAIARRADGKVLVGGEFTSVSAQPRTNLALLYPEEQFIRFTGVFPHSPAGKRLTLAVVPELTYTLQTSTDLVNWQDQQTKLAAADALEFIDTSDADSSKRFFRVKQSEP